MTPLARKTDPASSHLAAQKAQSFAGSHAKRIALALQELGRMTAHAIADATGLTVVQVDRRLPELQRRGAVRLVQDDGRVVVVSGYRMWEAAQ